MRERWNRAKCPKCNEKERVRHVIHCDWHECKKCWHTWSESCSPHRHGLSAAYRVARQVAQ